jgi:hypothetical protein
VRLDIIEKIVFVFAVIAIVLVAGLVVTFSIISKESGISKEEVDATIAVDDWLDKARQLANGQQVSTSKILLSVPVAAPVGAASPGQQPGKSGAPAAGGANAPQIAQQKTGDNYFDSSGNIPPQERVEGIPWLRKQEGVTYYKPESVPQILYQKFQSFDDAWQVAQEGGGEFVDNRYRVNWITPDSYLATKVGLQPGDEVISVNGHPVGNSFSAGRAMYDDLKNEKHFAVKVRRNGQDVVLSFYVN